jgi:NAD(P)-dependent dehydrogenase (short-subunit alcohol dehydrogenase family)
VKIVFNFDGKVVVVTGAAGTLARAVARHFAAAGANIALVDINQNLLSGVLSGQADLIDEDSVADMVAEVMDRFGAIDVLANIAGGFTMGPRVHETNITDWNFMLDLNAKSVFLTCRAVIPHMLTPNGGKIVNIAARVANEGKGRMAPYSVSKSAVARLTESLAAEYRNDNININCIMPGTIDTPANRHDMPDADYSKWVAPAALAEVILFLASDAARAIHGASIPVFGLT